MSGHNKWSKIKHKKAASDSKKSNLFSKHIKAIADAAKANPNPEANLSLKSAIDRAKADNVPVSNIQNALQKAEEKEDSIDLLIEAYGPKGEAILILAKTDNSNRTIAELKKALSNLGAKFADPGSVLWAFKKNELGLWEAKFSQNSPEEEKSKLDAILSSLKEHQDVEEIYTNIK